MVAYLAILIPFNHFRRRSVVLAMNVHVHVDETDFNRKESAAACIID